MVSNDREIAYFSLRQDKVSNMLQSWSKNFGVLSGISKPRSKQTLAVLAYCLIQDTENRKTLFFSVPNTVLHENSLCNYTVTFRVSYTAATAYYQRLEWDWIQMEHVVANTVNGGPSSAYDVSSVYTHVRTHMSILLIERTNNGVSSFSSWFLSSSLIMR